LGYTSCKEIASKTSYTYQQVTKQGLVSSQIRTNNLLMGQYLVIHEVWL